MSATLIGALGDLMRLQRWNAMPRVEVWSEAENIAYTTHITYAIGKLDGMSNEMLLHGMLRALLKSLNKHLVSDILVGTRDVIRSVNPEAWKKLIDEAAKETAKLFPRQIYKSVHKYMTHDGNYSIPDDDGSNKNKIENLIKYTQFKVAMSECVTNMKVYEKSYETVKHALGEKLDSLEGSDRFEEYYAKLEDFPQRIENLKNLRRWNRVNRSVETTVLGHTFIVTLLALVVSLICRDDSRVAEKNPKPPEFVYKAILRALFHDVPETFTGDIISPVKEIINKTTPGLLSEVEKEMMKDFKEAMPESIHKDIDRYLLLEELDDSVPYSIPSLVKACDSLAIVLECLFEKETGRVGGEMTSAYISYISRLQNSEWEPIRYLSTQVLLEHPKASWK